MLYHMCAGKSTAAKKLGGEIVSADDFFLVKGER